MLKLVCLPACKHFCESITILFAQICFVFLSALTSCFLCCTCSIHHCINAGGDILCAITILFLFLLLLHFILLLNCRTVLFHCNVHIQTCEELQKDRLHSGRKRCRQVLCMPVYVYAYMNVVVVWYIVDTREIVSICSHSQCFYVMLQFIRKWSSFLSSCICRNIQTHTLENQDIFNICSQLNCFNLHVCMHEAII